MTPEDKANFEALKGSRASEVLSRYLEHRLEGHKTALMTASEDQVKKLQGRANELTELLAHLKKRTR